MVKTSFLGLWPATFFCFLSWFSRLANLPLAASLSLQVRHAIEYFYEQPGLFLPQLKQHFGIAVLRLITRICWYTLPHLSSKFNNIYVFLTQKVQAGLAVSFAA